MFHFCFLDVFLCDSLLHSLGSSGFPFRVRRPTLSFDCGFDRQSIVNAIRDFDWAIDFLPGSATTAFAASFTNRVTASTLQLAADFEQRAT